MRHRNPSPLVGLSKLEHAHACFRGVKRPCDTDESGEGVIAYVLKPSSFYEYAADPVCVAKKAEVPSDLVFVAYVRLDVPCEPFGHILKGILTHWQFVESDRLDESLPVDFETRYSRRLW